LLDDALIFDAVNVLVDVWIVEQHHDELSPYRKSNNNNNKKQIILVSPKQQNAHFTHSIFYVLFLCFCCCSILGYLELAHQGKGPPTSYTGMSWSGFRPSDDKCQYGYLVPANIHAAAGLERVLEMNARIWMSDELDAKARKLLHDIEDGIRKYGIVQASDDDDESDGKGGEPMYAYEVDGFGGVLKDFDDANVPSLLSIPLLGWSGYNKTVYQTTRSRIMNPELNKFYHVGEKLVGQGSPHTPSGYVWPMSFAITALTTTGTKEEIAKSMSFELQQSLDAACNDAAHEGVSSMSGCPSFSRDWFEWSNAMFVVLVETALGERCDAIGKQAILQEMSYNIVKHGANPRFFENKFKTDPTIPNLYGLGIQAQVPYGPRSNTSSSLEETTQRNKTAGVDRKVKFSTII
jgi:meiotically up-regulated gene 157 (Mug157) protein